MREEDGTDIIDGMRWGLGVIRVPDNGLPPECWFVSDPSAVRRAGQVFRHMLKMVRNLPDLSVDMMVAKRCLGG